MSQRVCVGVCLLSYSQTHLCCYSCSSYRVEELCRQAQVVVQRQEGNPLEADHDDLQQNTQAFTAKLNPDDGVWFDEQLILEHLLPG